MTTIATDKQKEFEKQVAKIFKIDDYLSQRESSEQMIIDDFGNSPMDVLSGSIGYKKNNGDVILIATKDSEVNYISEITLKMVKIIVSDYCNKKRKVILATNIPVAIHIHTAKEFKKEFKFSIEKIGYSFCRKHNLEYIDMY